MMDDISDIAQFYDSNPEGEHGRVQQHQREYELTWRYLHQSMSEESSGRRPRTSAASPRH